MMNRPTKYKNYKYILQHEHRDDMNKDLSQTVVHQSEDYILGS